jgi:hypothetical protein
MRSTWITSYQLHWSHFVDKVLPGFLPFDLLMLAGP